VGDSSPLPVDTNIDVAQTRYIASGQNSYVS
jgi:hypothetical protein